MKNVESLMEFICARQLGDVVRKVHFSVFGLMFICNGALKDVNIPYSVWEDIFCLEHDSRSNTV